MTSDSDDLDELRKQLKLRQKQAASGFPLLPRTGKQWWSLVAAAYGVGFATIIGKMFYHHGPLLLSRPLLLIAPLLLTVMMGIIPFIIGLAAWAFESRFWLWFAIFAYAILLGNVNPK